ncbi:hypothetical protein [Streptomyces sp. NPDC057460]|uniref:hypothetical protein n=1 Tax=Streptomyces sp. NPDC057460 TaxID=3346141 RepID=UPI0036C1C16F
MKPSTMPATERPIGGLSVRPWPAGCVPATPGRTPQAITSPSSRSTALLMRLALPALRVPRVLGVDGFALKRRQRYASILTAAVALLLLRRLRDATPKAP